MKILVLKNRINDKLKSKLENVRKWFLPIVDIEFVEEKSSFKNIKMGDYSYIDGTLQTYQAPDEQWYDDNISKPAKERNFDIVIFLVKQTEWGNNIVDGFGTTIQDCGIEEIAIKYFTSGTYTFGWNNQAISLEGNKLEWIIIHELLHRIYSIKKLEDNTHKYFLKGTPWKCLEDFKMKTYKYFSQKEVDKYKLTPELFAILDEMRENANTPFIITSGLRTVEENQKIGGVSNSAHLKGLAVDLLCNNNIQRDKMLRGVYLSKIPVFLEIAKAHLHIDIDSSIHSLNQTMVSDDD